MMEFVSQPAMQAALGIAVILVVAYAAFQLVVWLRPTTCKPDTNVDRLAQNFEEMRLEGDIDEAELRKIKAVLGKTQDSNSSGQSAS